MRVVANLLALSLLAFAKPATTPHNAPKLLLQILHCAETDKFGLLDASLKKDDVIKAYWHRSPALDSGVPEEFFIVLPDSEKSGDILVYVRGFQKGKVHFYLVNNARLSIEHGEVKVVDPLGGIWIYNHIRRSVKIALDAGQYSIPAKILVGSFPNVGCHSYSDPE